MKTYFKTTLLFLFVFSMTGFAQINFEHGYFINSQGEQINCLIKNLDWKNNPTEFEYKLTENSETQFGNIKQVSEFSISGGAKFIRTKVEIDLSSNVLSELSIYREPNFESKELFLKVLVTGSSNLYKYSKTGMYRYFFNKPNTEIKQLVFKKYLLNIENKTGKNDMYKQQLFNEVNCNATPIKNFISIKYHEKDLVKYFTNYNRCSGDNAVEEKKEKRKWFSLRVRPGITFSSLSINHDRDKFDFNKETGFSIGLQAGCILPFNKNKWEVFIEPTYHSYKTTGKFNDFSQFSNNIYEIAVDYKSIELPFGVKHKFYINNNVNIFLSVGYYVDISLNSTVKYKSGKTLEVESTSSILGGVGIEVLKKFSVEYRVLGSRGLFSNNTAYDSSYQSSSIILGYKLF